jgi:tRNA A-37 threonylcarbamoyl transferase component Bud32
VNPLSEVSPETDRKLVVLVLGRGLVSKSALEQITRERGQRRGSLARALCERGLMSRDNAFALLREIRDARETVAFPEAKVPSTAQQGVQQMQEGVLALGSRLGSYRIDAELGRGGQGAVYRAFDERLRREVALKTLVHGDLEARERFVREARAAARIRHPGVVAVLGAELVAGIPVIALELVKGTSLAKKINEKGPLAPHEAATIVRDVALAVAAAHAEGILHRDLKPANVLLDESGRPRLADFGLARDLDATKITATGVAMGTPAYMAPEQALASAASQATDVYGLGAILYHALAGRPPFSGTGLAVLRQVIEEDPPRPSLLRVTRGLAALPLDLETVVLKALEKRPERRYSSAKAVAQDLDRFVRGEPVSARPPGAIERVWRQTFGKRPLLSAFVATLLVALAMVLAAPLIIVRARSNERTLEQARVAREHTADIARARSEAKAAASAFAAADAKFAGTQKDLNSHLDLGIKASNLADSWVLLARADVDDQEARGESCRVKRLLGEAALYCDELALAIFVFGQAKDLATGTEREAIEQRIARARSRSSRKDDVIAAEQWMASVDPARREQAVRLLSSLLDDDPGWLRVHLDRAHGEARLGDFASARNDIDVVLRAKPSNLVAHEFLTGVLMEQGDIHGAIEEAGRTIELDATNQAAYRVRALARRKTGELAGARSDTEKYMQLASPEARIADMVALEAELGDK